MVAKTESVSAPLKAFRRKMGNPVYWRRANRIIAKYTKPDVSSVDSATRVITDLALSFGIELTPCDRKRAAEWLVQQDIDPQSRKDRLLLWKKAK